MIQFPKLLKEIETDFEHQLDFLLNQIKIRATSQFKYNLETNVPAGLVTLDDSAVNALETGTIGAINQFLQWDCDKTNQWAIHLLENCNCHGEAKALANFIKLDN